MDLVDTTIVNVALPQIRGSLHAGGAAAEWVVAGYALTFGAGLITGGRLGGAFGRRRVFLAATAAFMAASLPVRHGTGRHNPDRRTAGPGPGRGADDLAGPDRHPGQLHRRRAVPVAYAAYEACAAIATVSGPLLGGFLVQADLLGLG